MSTEPIGVFSTKESSPAIEGTTVSVQDFGPIVEAVVELKPLTIFLGPSNTGKSYMATAVYTLMQAAANSGNSIWVGGRYGKFAGKSSPIFEQSDDIEEYDAVVETFLTWENQQVNLADSLRELTVSDLPRDVVIWLTKSTFHRLITLQKEVIDQFRQIHGEGYGFVKRGKTSEDFRLVIRKEDPLLNLDIRLAGDTDTVPEFDISQANVPDVELELMLYRRDPKGYDWAKHDAFGLVENLVSKRPFSKLPRLNYYLPAGRSGTLEAYKFLSASVVRNSSRRVARNLNIPALTAITAEFLGHLISLDQRMRTQRRNADLENAISFIENKVLQGKIDLDESASLPYPEIAYETGAGKFSLDQSSSMVSELAPLILFLKYLVRPGDLLILEEPESHLHPAAQLQLARGIARLVNAGVQVLITTHSNDFTGQINNLISMSNVSEETWKSLGLEQEECLQPEQVSAYGFRIDPGKGGAVTYPLTVGADVGIEDEEFLPVIELLYDQAITMQRNRLS